MFCVTCQVNAQTVLEVDILGGCDALVLECNHDRQMLATSAYPPSLKLRIGGAYGHLSNQTSSEILAAIDRRRLRTVVGAHLSSQNNTPALARDALCSVVDPQHTAIMIACQQDGLAGSKSTERLCRFNFGNHAIDYPPIRPQHDVTDAFECNVPCTGDDC